MIYFHGSYNTIMPGDNIFPRSQLPTGHPALGPNKPLDDGDWVHVTSDPEFAAFYASTLMGWYGPVQGSLYEVEPLGELEIDPDFDPSWFPDIARVRSALVISVAQHVVNPGSVRYDVDKKYTYPRPLEQ